MTPGAGHQKPEATEKLVMIGEISKPHGIRGEVKVYSFSGQPENFAYYNTIVLRRKSGEEAGTYKIVRTRVQGKVAILLLEGLNTRDAAEALQGCTVWLDPAELQKLEPDEYYWHQLKGLTVLTESGRELGAVVDLFSTPAHDIMVVKGEGREYLIPVKTEIVINIDESGGKIYISPPAGLLDINK